MAVESEVAGSDLAAAPPTPAFARTRSRAQRDRRRFRVVLGAMTGGLLLTVTAGVSIGAVSIAPRHVWGIVAHHVLPQVFSEGDWTPAHEQIVWTLRLPRVLLGALVGGGLAVVGTALQALVRNPLADPYVFGITSGASVGATCVLVFGIGTFGQFTTSVAAFLGAVVAFSLVLILARLGGGLSPARLILAGVSVAYTMSALTSFLVFLARDASDNGVAQAVLFWLLGSLGAARWNQLAIPAVAVLAGTALLLLQARSLNALLVGDETAATLGIDLRKFRKQLFVLSALLIGVVVSVAGGIGFIGLMVPHTVRMLVGSDHRRVLPVAMLLGAGFMIWADILARTVVSPLELPIGIVTALSGTPFFVLIMRQRGRAARYSR